MCAQQIESIDNLEDTKGHSVCDWVTLLAPNREVYNRFKNFLRTFVDAKGHNLYKEKIRQMVECMSTFPLIETINSKYTPISLNMVW